MNSCQPALGWVGSGGMSIVGCRWQFIVREAPRTLELEAGEVSQSRSAKKSTTDEVREAGDGLRRDLMQATYNANLDALDNCDEATLGLCMAMVFFVSISASVLLFLNSSRLHLPDFPLRGFGGQWPTPPDPIAFPDFAKRMAGTYKTVEDAFDDMDKDGQGSVSFGSFTEMTRSFKKPLNFTQEEFAFKELDCNRDDRLTKEELFQAVEEERFGCTAFSTSTTSSTTAAPTAEASSAQGRGASNSSAATPAPSPGNGTHPSDAAAPSLSWRESYRSRLPKIGRTIGVQITLDEIDLTRLSDSQKWELKQRLAKELSNVLEVETSHVQDLEGHAGSLTLSSLDHSVSTFDHSLVLDCRVKLPADMKLPDAKTILTSMATKEKLVLQAAEVRDLQDAATGDGPVSRIGLAVGESSKDDFLQLDRNLDKHLDPKEFLLATKTFLKPSQKQEPAEDLFHWLDTNHDGLLDSEEFFAQA